jgi:hypothetical protein
VVFLVLPLPLSVNNFGFYPTKQIHCEPFCFFYFRALFGLSCWPRQGLGTRARAWAREPGPGHESQSQGLGTRARAWVRESEIIVFLDAEHVIGGYDVINTEY